MRYAQHLTPELIERGRLTPRQLARRIGAMKRNNFAADFHLTVGSGHVFLLLSGKVSSEDHMVQIDAIDYPLVGLFTWWVNKSGESRYVHTAGYGHDGRWTTK